MAFEIATGFVQIEPRGVKKTEREVKKLEKGIKKTDKATKSLGKTFLKFFAGAAIVAGLRTSIRLFAVQEKAEARLESQIIATGMAAGFTAGQLKQQASALQDVTLFGDEVTIGAQAILTSFREIQGVNFQRTIQSAQDLATIMDTDLKSATIQLGKALNDPIANLSALSRSGIQFTIQQKAQIKGLVEQNKLFEAQTIILDELNTQFGGAAQAEADTMTGKIQQMTNAWGDLGEAIGKAATAGPSGGIVGWLKEVAEAAAEVLDNDTSATTPSQQSTSSQIRIQNSIRRQALREQIFAGSVAGRVRERTPAGRADVRERNTAARGMAGASMDDLELTSAELLDLTRKRIKALESELVLEKKLAEERERERRAVVAHHAFPIAPVPSLFEGLGGAMADGVKVALEAAERSRLRTKGIKELEAEKAALLDDAAPSTNFRSQTMGLAGIGASIQQAALNKDDTEKKALAELEKHTTSLDLMIEALKELSPFGVLA